MQLFEIVITSGLMAIMTTLYLLLKEIRDFRRVVLPLMHSVNSSLDRSWRYFYDQQNLKKMNEEGQTMASQSIGAVVREATDSEFAQNTEKAKENIVASVAVTPEDINASNPVTAQQAQDTEEPKGDSDTAGKDFAP